MNTIKPLPIETFGGQEQDILHDIFKDYFPVTDRFIFDLPFDSVTASIRHAGKIVGRYNFKTEELTIFNS